MAEDKNYMRIIEKLMEIKIKTPNIRFGYVMQGALDYYKRQSNVNLNDISSKQILKGLIEFDEWSEKKKIKKPKEVNNIDNTI